MGRTAGAEMNRFLAIFLLLAGCGGAGAETFRDRDHRITDGRASAGQRAPLIVALHPFLGTPRSMSRTTGFDALARQNGLVVVYPEGKRRRWNDGRSPRNRVDDVGYLSDLIAKLIADGSAGPKRVFVAGFSNGGGMAMRLACDRPDLVRGIAVIATKLPSAYPCRGGPAVPAIFFHGTADPIAPHGGRPAGSRLGATLSADETLAVWSARNGCRGAEPSRKVDRRDDGTSAEIIRYQGCSDELTHVVIDGHGHGWPGSSSKGLGLQGPASQEVDATDMTWRFFQALY